MAKTAALTSSNRSIAPSIELREYASRRERLLKALDGHVAIVPAGEADASLHHPWVPHAHFTYLTGVTDEPGATLVLDSAHPVASKRCTLLLRPLNPEVEKWDGFRAELSSALRARYGISSVMRISMLPRLLLEAARRSRKLAAVMPLAPFNAPVSSDLAILRSQAERIPGCSIIDRSGLIPAMRAAKSKAEIGCIRHAGEISAHGFNAALAVMRAGITEFDVQEAMEHAYRTNGARDTAYRTIAGSGFNATVLHYHANDQVLADGDLVVLDSGAAFGGYASDVTRTYPVSGRFTARQRELYSIVLKSLEAGIKACRAGTTLGTIDAACRKVINDAGHGDAFIHGAGHHLGLEVHDSSPDAPLPDGAVVTVEPGIYLPGEKIGIRIEDDIVCTKKGPINLTGSIPKSIADIERAMGASIGASKRASARRRPR
ncbi:MAG: Xaa-Pro peptidase family protein [Planctomycetota bacterium]|nr:Xaa-Pro peptidase family protein [Planctomycetota bacterium]